MDDVEGGTLCRHMSILKGLVRTHLPNRTEVIDILVQKSSVFKIKLELESKEDFTSGNLVGLIFLNRMTTRSKRINLGTFVTYQEKPYK